MKVTKLVLSFCSPAVVCLCVHINMWMLHCQHYFADILILLSWPCTWCVFLCNRLA